jgi:hypothetical protein
VIFCAYTCFDQSFPYWKIFFANNLLEALWKNGVLVMEIS